MKKFSMHSNHKTTSVRLLGFGSDKKLFFYFDIGIKIIFLIFIHFLDICFFIILSQLFYSHCYCLKMKICTPAITIEVSSVVCK